MPNPVAFPHGEPIRALETEMNALSNIVEESTSMLERERDKMVNTVNFLEALYANLIRQHLGGSHLSLVAEGPSASSTEAE